MIVKNSSKSKVGQKIQIPNKRMGLSQKLFFAPIPYFKLTLFELTCWDTQIFPLKHSSIVLK